MSGYKEAGVDYAVLDSAKRAALGRARELLGTATGSRVSFLAGSLGETASVFDVAGTRLALVAECLGTKVLLAEELRQLTGENRYADIGFDGVAACVNDLVAVGAVPAVVHAYFATGSSSWYAEPERAQALVDGWADGCRASGALWGGGESPTLVDVVEPAAIDIAGCALGVIPGGEADTLLEPDLRPGDEIVLVAASGFHTNGYSLVRRALHRLPGGLDHRLPSGRAVASAALDRSVIYVDALTAVRAAGARVKYVSHVTGHGWRKLMRSPQQVRYVMDTVPPVPEVMEFVVAETGMSPADAYGTFNMGAGLALFCASGETEAVVAAVAATGLDAWRCGSVEAGPREVVVAPYGVTFGSEDLELR